MTWNYRVLKQRHKDGSWSYGVHEMFYDERGKPIAFTEDPVGPGGTSLRELHEDLRCMLRDVRGRKAIDAEKLLKKLRSSRRSKEAFA